MAKLRYGIATTAVTISIKRRERKRQFPRGIASFAVSSSRDGEIARRFFGIFDGEEAVQEERRLAQLVDNRVEINEVDSEASDLDSLDITGDYLLGTNRKPNALKYEFFNTPRGTAFSYDTPEYGEPPLTQAQEAQQAYLLAHMSRVEDAVYGKDFTNAEGDYVWDLIDMASFADMWWVQEFTVNPDAYATPSTYLYKKRDQVADDRTVTTGKLYWGPLWDFDFVWGKLPAEGFDNVQYEWAILLRQDPVYVDLLKQRWQVLDGVLEEATREGGLLDCYIKEMSQSWDANQQRWPQDHPYAWDDESYTVTIEELRNHIEARRAWINANLDQLQTVYHTITFMDGDDVVSERRVRDGYVPWEDAPDALEKEGMIFHGWFTEDGVEYVAEEPCREDTVYYAEYYDEATGKATATAKARLAPARAITPKAAPKLAPAATPPQPSHLRVPLQKRATAFPSPSWLDLPLHPSWQPSLGSWQ